MLWMALLGWSWAADVDPFPNLTYTSDQAWSLITPSLGNRHMNQPSAVNGVLLFGGNAVHEVWDVADPFSPVRLAVLSSPHHSGEAESHQVAYRRVGNKHQAATISGKGVDLWDLTRPRNPKRLSSLQLDGIDYGDNTEAVWGVFWQGDALYVGGTNTGLHVVDTSDPTDPQVVLRLPTTAMGGVSAGPVWAVGNLLVVTTPKDHRGVATLDIRDPWDPFLLDHEVPDDDAYIGGFYGGHAFLVDPFRTFDVTTDPTDIRMLGSVATPDTEYLSFGDDWLFLGGMRPAPGIFKYDFHNPKKLVLEGKVDGRVDAQYAVLTDDQFGFPVANLLVICDDEITYGCVIGVHDTQPDDTPPEVLYVNPPDGATNQALTTRVGLSFSDQIDLRTVDADSLVVRALSGGPISGQWGHVQTVVTFWPDQPLDPDTTYEIVLPTDGITDLAGNRLSAEFRTVFSTGADVQSLACEIDAGAVQVGRDGRLVAAQAGPGVDYRWDFGDGRTGRGRSVSHAWKAPGRYVVGLTVDDGTVRRGCSATQVVHHPTRDATNASTVVVDGTTLWVVNPDDDSVSEVDLGSWKTVRHPVGDQPRGVAVGGGAVWVTNRGDDTLSVLTGDEVDTIRLPRGSRPFSVAVDGDTVWVTLEGTGELARIEGRRVRERIGLGRGGPPETWPMVRGLALDGEGVPWVSRFVSGDEGGVVYRVGEEVSEVAVSWDPGPDESDGGRGLPNYLSTLAISPDGTRMAIPSKKDNVQRGQARDGELLDADNTVRTIVSFIDLEGGVERPGERVDLDDHEMAYAATWSPRGDLLFVASQGTNQVDVLDAWDGRKVAGFATGLAPNGLVIANGVLYVQNLLSRSVSAFDVQGILDGTDGAATHLGDIVTVDVEPLAPEVLLGKQIFYNARSAEMSQDGYLSCATCHLDGLHDGRVWDFTQRGEGLRNTIDLLGKAGTGHGPVHWTANFDEIQDFENDIRHGFGGSGFLDDKDFDKTEDPLGDPKAGRSERLDALAAYVATLDTFPRSPHRGEGGALTDDGKAGLKLLRKKGCVDCHSGAALTDSGKKRHDVGTTRKSSGQRRGGKLDGLDTPTLHGLWATAPYLHDGSAPTLRVVLNNEDHVGKLSEREKDQLEAALRQVEPQDLPVEGCGCAHATGLGGWWVVPLLWWRRRRRVRIPRDGRRRLASSRPPAQKPGRRELEEETTCRCSDRPRSPGLGPLSALRGW